jgi:phosphoglycerate dehydrogenase-like enzyme
MKIVLNGPVAKPGLEILRRRFGPAAEIAAVDHRQLDQRALRAFAEAEVLVSISFDAALPPAPRLRLVHVPAAGLDSVDLGAVPDQCRVCNVFEHEIGISEYVMAAMLHHVVDLAGRSARFQAGSWADSPRLAAPLRPELARRTVGTIGYGHIGRAIARRVKACGMRVMALARTRRELDPAPDWLGEPQDLPALLQASDFVVVACPLNQATRGLIAQAQLAQMKRDAVLINVARGPIVDEDALYEALATRRIGGAVLDTWYSYPEPDDVGVRPSRHPFHELDNVVMTPHCSGWTEGLMERRFAVIADNVERLQGGRPLINQVHPAAEATATGTTDA